MKFRLPKFIFIVAMNAEERDELLKNLQKYSAHRSIEIANSNVQHLKLLHECSVKDSQIRNLSMKNLQYSIASQIKAPTS